MTSQPNKPSRTPEQQEAIDKVGYFMQEYIPFNKFIGLEIVEVEAERALLRLPFKEELVGDPQRRAIHGGVLSSVLDVAGGTGDVAFRFLQAAECIERTKSSNPAALMKFPLPSVISIPTCYASVNVVLATCLEMPYLMRV